MSIVKIFFMHVCDWKYHSFKAPHPVGQNEVTKAPPDTSRPLSINAQDPTPSTNKYIIYERKHLLSGKFSQFFEILI